VDVQETQVTSDRVLTNVLSFARLLGVPVFLWLITAFRRQMVAIALLGITDWLTAIWRVGGIRSRGLGSY
jgi:cardiolipin synthase